MVDKRYIERLRDTYNVPQEELKNMGLVKAPKKCIVGRVTKAEHEALNNICIELQSTMTHQVVQKIEEALKDGKLDVKKIRRLTEKQIKVTNDFYVNIKVEEDIYKNFLNLCSNNHMKKSRVIRSFIIQIIKKYKEK